MEYYCQTQQTQTVLTVISALIPTFQCLSVIYDFNYATPSCFTFSINKKWILYRIILCPKIPQMYHIPGPGRCTYIVLDKKWSQFTLILETSHKALTQSSFSPFTLCFYLSIHDLLTNSPLQAMLAKVFHFYFSKLFKGRISRKQKVGGKQHREASRRTRVNTWKLFRIMAFTAEVLFYYKLDRNVTKCNIFTTVEMNQFVLLLDLES